MPGAVLRAGAAAATLDIAFAIGFWLLRADVPPLRILQSVASGLLGPAAFDGGRATAALGLALHYAIALAMAATYAAAASSVPTLARRPLAAGAAYGLALYVAMNHVVVPLSAAGPGPRDPLWIACSVLAHVLLVGVPIAWIVARARTPAPGGLSARRRPAP